MKSTWRTTAEQRAPGSSHRSYLLPLDFSVRHLRIHVLRQLALGMKREEEIGRRALQPRRTELRDCPPLSGKVKRRGRHCREVSAGLSSLLSQGAALPHTALLSCWPLESPSKPLQALTKLGMWIQKWEPHSLGRGPGLGKHCLDVVDF